MKTFSAYAKVFFLAGCIVFLGLNTAAQGLQNMAPDFPHRVFEFTQRDQVWSVSAMGKNYHWDTRGAVRLMNEVEAKAKILILECWSLLFS